MSLYQFFPMKKRKICKIPNGRSKASTLGKFKGSLDGTAPSTGGNGIEILWDNNSPSPSTTIALAGKRRRQNPVRHGTDVSFVVQKLSENASPVPNHAGPSGLLEMWTEKADQKIGSCICEDDFSSPPFRQTKYENTTSPQSTPLFQRRTSKRQSRKASRQFMLKIRKLVEEIQKSDLSCSSQSQKEIQGKPSEDRTQIKRIKRNGDASTVVTQVKQHLTRNGERDCKTNVTGTAEPCTAISDCLLEDSFEWTEDDMDELVLTCQLSSSGKGSLTIPEPSRPRFGASPSQVSVVPETQFTQICSRAPDAETHKRPDPSSPSQCTQILFPEEEDKKLSNTNEVRQFEHAQQVPEHEDTDQWELNFDDDDSLLASAMHEFELSQEAIAKPKLNQNDKNSKNSSSKIKEPQKNDGLVTNRLTKRFNFTEKKVKNLQKESTKSSSSKEPVVKNALSKTRTASHLTINSKVGTKLQKISPTTTSNSSTRRSNDLDARKMDKMAVQQSKSNNLLGERNCAEIAKIPGNSGTKVSEKSLNKLPTQMNSTSMLGKGFCAKQVNDKINKTKDVSSGNMATSWGRDRTSARSTPCGKASTSLGNVARANENIYSRNNVRTRMRDNVEGGALPLQSLPGNSSFSETKQPQNNSECSKEKQASRLRQTSNSTREFLSKTEGKPSLLQQSNFQNSSEMQKIKNQENEFDFLMNEDDFTALLDDFNFDDVLAQAASLGSTNTTNNPIKPCTNSSAPSPSLPVTGEKKVKYSQAEIERKRKEAQRRRVAKAKQKSATQLNNGRISKR